MYEYFALGDPERNYVPLHLFSLANHWFAFGIRSLRYYFETFAQYSRIFMLPVSIQ